MSLSRAVRALSLATLLGAGCHEAGPVAEPAEAAASVQLTHRIFGESTDPERVVATVGDTNILARDVAGYLDWFPTLTTAQAVADLTDIAAIRQNMTLATPERARIAELDARIRGRAAAYMRHVIYEDPTLGSVDKAAVDEAAADPSNSIYYGGIPELVRASHILIRVDKTKEPAEKVEKARTEAQQIFEELRATNRPVPLSELQRVAQAHAKDRPKDSPDIRIETGLVFPKRYSGVSRWDSLDAVVDPFADASFAAADGEVVGPVESTFGFHVILVESHIAARMPSDAVIRAKVEELLLLRKRQDAMQKKLAELGKASEVLLFPDNMSAFTQDALQQMQQNVTARGKALTK